MEPNHSILLVSFYKDYKLTEIGTTEILKILKFLRQFRQRQIL